MKMFLGLLWVCAVCAQTWTPLEMMKTKNVTDVVFSPDNQTVLFVASSVDLEMNIYKSQIYRVGAEGASEVFTPSDSTAARTLLAGFPSLHSSEVASQTRENPAESVRCRRPVRLPRPIFASSCPTWVKPSFRTKPGVLFALATPKIQSNPSRAASV